MTDIERLSTQIDRLRETVEQGHRELVDRLGGVVERTVRAEVQLAALVADVATVTEEREQLEKRVRALEGWRWWAAGVVAALTALAGLAGYSLHH